MVYLQTLWILQSILSQEKYTSKLLLLGIYGIVQITGYIAVSLTEIQQHWKKQKTGNNTVPEITITSDLQRALAGIFNKICPQFLFIFFIFTYNN